MGNDYNTPDGTCIRDFIHVIDLARAHVIACTYQSPDKTFDIFNIGTGKGYSVSDIVSIFIKTNNVILPFQYVNRRDGDLEIVFCDCEKAKQILNWSAMYTLEDIVKDSWNFILKHHITK